MASLPQCQYAQRQRFDQDLNEMSLAVAERDVGASSMPRLRAYGRDLDPAPDRLGWLMPTPADRPVRALREQFHEHGYLWLKGFLDPEEVTAFRGYVFRHMDGCGLTAPGSDPALGLSSGQPPRKDLVDRKLMALVRSAAYEAFCVQPRLWQFMDAFVEGLSYLHKRKLLRYTQPGTDVSTAAHYDLIYLRGGTSRLVTAWIPVGDIPVEMGGLCYLEGSHAIGSAMEVEFTRKAADLTPEERISAYNKNMSEGGWISKDLPDMAERFDARWLIADYEAGDVVLHSPFMIHASTTNVDPQNRIRLSTDIRYQNVDDEIDARWANHWTLGDML
jgi:ectoine hydroxylase-related dioxygenase (phytanoyl-CoA dioxygenase family)